MSRVVPSFTNTKMVITATKLGLGKGKFNTERSSRGIQQKIVKGQHWTGGRSLKCGVTEIRGRTCSKEKELSTVSVKDKHVITPGFANMEVINGINKSRSGRAVAKD